MDYRYHIRQFNWNKDTNCFYAEAPHLECLMPDGNTHPEAFPDMKGQFYIDNPKTGGFRRFRFVKENIIETTDGESQQMYYLYTEWIFESEDGIECRIAID